MIATRSDFVVIDGIYWLTYKATFDVSRNLPVKVRGCDQEETQVFPIAINGKEFVSSVELRNAHWSWRNSWGLYDIVDIFLPVFTPLPSPMGNRYLCGLKSSDECVLLRSSVYNRTRREINYVSNLHTRDDQIFIDTSNDWGLVLTPYHTTSGSTLMKGGMIGVLEYQNGEYSVRYYGEGGGHYIFTHNVVFLPPDRFLCAMSDWTRQDPWKFIFRLTAYDRSFNVYGSPVWTSFTGKITYTIGSYASRFCEFGLQFCGCPYDGEEVLCYDKHRGSFFVVSRFNVDGDAVQIVPYYHPSFFDFCTYFSCQRPRWRHTEYYYFILPFRFLMFFDWFEDVPVLFFFSFVPSVVNRTSSLLLFSIWYKHRGEEVSHLLGVCSSSWSSDRYFNNPTFLLVYLFDRAQRQLTLLDSIMTLGTSKFLTAFLRIETGRYLASFYDYSRHKTIIEEITFDPGEGKLHRRPLFEVNEYPVGYLAVANVGGREKILYQIDHNHPLVVLGEGTTSFLNINLVPAHSPTFPFNAVLKVSALDAFGNRSFARVLLRCETSNIKFADGFTQKVVTIYPNEDLEIPVIVSSPGKTVVTGRILEALL
jgi:hypothetical protein